MTDRTLLAAYPSLPLAGMQSLAARLAVCLKSGDTLTLTGEVGSGKTTFARALITAIAKESGEVTSPTFPLLQSYDVRLADGKEETVWHLDLYRLKKEEETEALGLRELWPHIVLIEWPQLIRRLLPPARLDITLLSGGLDARSVELRGNEAWRERLGALK